MNYEISGQCEDYFIMLFAFFLGMRRNDRQKDRDFN